MKKLRAFAIVSAFWATFGAIVFLSGFLVEDKLSRATNMISGAVLLAMAGVFLYLDRRRK